MDKKNKLTADEIQELEDQLLDLSIRSKQQFNDIQNLKGTYARIISKLAHNLKNPIGTIYSFSELMIDSKDLSSEKGLKYAEVIKNSAHFSISLINAISKYTNLISDKNECNIEKTNYLQLLNEVINGLENKFQTKNIVVEKHYNIDEITVDIDKLETALALEHIFTNAVRFSKNDTKIVVTVEVDNKNLITKINDFGIGVKVEDLEKITNPFFVVNTYDVDGNKCIGLGLSITKEIIEHQNGVLDIYSKINQGTLVTLTFPLTKI